MWSHTNGTDAGIEIQRQSSPLKTVWLQVAMPCHTHHVLWSRLYSVRDIVLLGEAFLWRWWFLVVLCPPLAGYWGCVWRVHLCPPHRQPHELLHWTPGEGSFIVELLYIARATKINHVADPLSWLDQIEERAIGQSSSDSLWWWPIP